MSIGVQKGSGIGVQEGPTRGVQRVAPLPVAIDALERGIARRSRRVVAPRWAAPLLPLRMAVQPFVDIGAQRNLAASLEIARGENAPLTTPQPGAEPGTSGDPA